MNRTKKILSIIALSFIGLLAIATIVLAIVPSSFDKGIIPSNPITVTVYTTDNDTLFAQDNDRYNELIDLVDNSFKESTLSALFQGAYGFENEVQTSVSSTTISSVKTNYAIQLDYGTTNDYTLKINNKEYTYGANNNKTVKFDSVLFAVNDTNNLSSVTVYLLNDGSATGSVTVQAKQTKLYDYLTNLKF